MELIVLRRLSRRSGLRRRDARLLLAFLAVPLSTDFLFHGIVLRAYPRAIIERHESAMSRFFEACA